MRSQFIKKLVILTSLITALILPVNAFAQGIMGSPSSPQTDTRPAVSINGHTAVEEAEGKEIWNKLQSGQLECNSLTDDQYTSLGEYFMGQMMGSSHEAMNNMMIQMMGEEGEKQMHVAMGKRSSVCDPDVQSSSNGFVFMPMMGGGSYLVGGLSEKGTDIFGVLSGISMFTFWLFLVLGVVALGRHLARSGRTGVDKTPLLILKERYAGGEIDKKEFEDKKKDLL